MAQKTFDFNQCTLAINASLVSNYADGTSIDISPSDNVFNEYVDGNGNTTRVLTNNNNYTMVLRLAMSSSTNKTLSDFHLLDKKTGQGSFALTFKDNVGGTLIQTASASVKKVSNASFGNNDNVREWELLLIDTSYYLSGVGI